MHWQIPDLMSFCMEQIMPWIREKGITNCLSNWEKKHPDIKILGINKSQDAQDTITVLEQNGIKIAVLNYTYGLNGIALPSDMPYAVNLLDEEK